MARDLGVARSAALSGCALRVRTLACLSPRERAAPWLTCAPRTPTALPSGLAAGLCLFPL